MRRAYSDRIATDLRRDQNGVVAHAVCVQCGCGLSHYGGDPNALALRVLSDLCRCEKSESDQQIIAARGVGRMLRWLAPDVEHQIWLRKMDREHAAAVESNRRDREGWAASVAAMESREWDERSRPRTEGEKYAAQMQREYEDRSLLHRAIDGKKLRPHEEQRAQGLKFAHYCYLRGGLGGGLSASESFSAVMNLNPPGPRPRY